MLFWKCELIGGMEEGRRRDGGGTGGGGNCFSS